MKHDCNYLIGTSGWNYSHWRNVFYPEESIKNFFNRIEVLKGSLVPILFQLLQIWHFEKERLINSIKVLPKKDKYIFEFQDKTWWGEYAVKNTLEIQAMLNRIFIDNY